MADADEPAPGRGRLVRSRAAHRGVATRYLHEAEQIFNSDIEAITDAEYSGLQRLHSVLGKN